MKTSALPVWLSGLSTGLLLTSIFWSPQAITTAWHSVHTFASDHANVATTYTPLALAALGTILAAVIAPPARHVSRFTVLLTAALILTATTRLSIPGSYAFTRHRIKENHQ